VLDHVVALAASQGLLGESRQQISVGMRFRRYRRCRPQSSSHDFGEALHLASVSSFQFPVSGFRFPVFRF
jgi:hypothetical protein